MWEEEEEVEEEEEEEEEEEKRRRRSTTDPRSSRAWERAKRDRNSVVAAKNSHQAGKHLASPGHLVHVSNPLRVDHNRLDALSNQAFFKKEERRQHCFSKSRTPGRIFLFHPFAEEA